MLSSQRVRFRLPAGAGNAARRWNEREVLQLVLQPPGEPPWLGEAAPLPGYSQESLDDAEQSLGSMGSLLPALLRLEDAGCLATALEQLPAPPSARYGLELALLRRLAWLAKRPVWRILAGAMASRAPAVGASAARAGTRLEPCALLSPASAECAAQQAAAYFSGNTRCFKVKLGPGRPTPCQLSILENLRGRYGSKVELRADANRSFHRDFNLDALNRFSLQFLEEPYSEPRWPKCQFRLALDETLAEAPRSRVERWLQEERVGAVVLKPTRLGGLCASMHWARVARSFGTHAVASHTFEGPVGFWGCEQLAVALAAEGETWAPGLGPYPREPAGDKAQAPERVGPQRRPGQ